jgi:diaminopimelate decarboxylase
MSAIRLPPVSQPTDAQKVLLPQAMGLLTDEAPCALFYDMDAYRAVLTSIKEAFPPSTLHAVAMKANPLAACLNIAKEMGMGIEVASPGEFEHARRLGFEPSKIVMDSPVSCIS